MDSLSRIVFLLDQYRLKIPKSVLVHLPYSEILDSVSELGASGTDVNFSLPQGQIGDLLKRGGGNGPGSEEELRLLIADLALGELELSRETLDLKTYLQSMEAVKVFATRGEELVTRKQIDLGSPEEEIEEIPKFKTGFEPLDLLTGGLYQGISVFMGKPGHGKTSLLLSVMEDMRIRNVCSSVWFFNIEIPEKMMLYKTRPMRDRTRFYEGKDILFCGYYPISEVARMLEGDPDPDRVLIVDGPDAMTGSSGDRVRFALAEIYVQLVQLKELTKHIMVSSQVRRKDKLIQLESGAESWQKAWYADILIGINKIGSIRRNRVWMKILKNRFGPVDREATFDYDFINLNYTGDFEEDDW